MDELKNNYSLEKIRVKLIYLYISNVTDLLLTLFLLSTGHFREFNKLMIGILSNPFKSILAKIILPMLLLHLLYLRLQGATKRQLKISNYLITGITLIYIIINISHMIWIFYYYLPLTF